MHGDVVPHTVITLNPIRSELPFRLQHFAFLFYFLCCLIKNGFHVKLTLFCLNSRGFDAWARGGYLAIRHLPPSGHARRSQERYLLLSSFILRKKPNHWKIHASALFCGSLMFIPGPNFFHPGSEFFPSRIRIKEFKYFNPKKWFLSSRKYDPDCSSRIRIRIPDLGFKKAPDPDPQHRLCVEKKADLDRI
jgi:hypothetical protein